MTTPLPSIVLSPSPRESDPADAKAWIEGRVRLALQVQGVDLSVSERLGIPIPLYQGALIPGGAERRFDVDGLIAEIVEYIAANGARVVHVLAEVPPAPPNVVTWNLGADMPPAGFMEHWDREGFRGHRIRAWDAFRFGAGVDGTISVAPGAGPDAPE